MWGALAVAMAACAAAGGAQAPIAPAPAATPESVKLVVLLPDDAAAKRVFELAEGDFASRHPGAEISAQTAAPDLVADLRRRADAGELPDLAWVDSSQLDALVRAGLLRDLQDVARLDRNLDPSAPAFGCDCQRPPAPFRLDNIASQALAGARVGGLGLYLIPALIGPGEPPQVAGFAILSATARFESAWPFARFLATDDGQRPVVAEKLGATVLRAP
jgi:ABC-type glycerol-3-phosphate transport system substrate-binding protein